MNRFKTTKKISIIVTTLLAVILTLGITQGFAAETTTSSWEGFIEPKPGETFQPGEIPAQVQPHSEADAYRWEIINKPSWNRKGTSHTYEINEPGQYVLKATAEKFSFPPYPPYPPGPIPRTEQSSTHSSSFEPIATDTVTIKVEEKPKEINTCSELQDIGRSGEYKLGNDIDCSGINNFDPITANSRDSFYLDGQGYAIKNVNIDRPDESYVGVFGHLKYDALVKNVGVEDVDITGRNYVGGLVGRQSYQAELKNTYATGTVEGNRDVGGLSGHKYDDITCSWADANVRGNTNVGAVVGNDRQKKSDYTRKSTTLDIGTTGQGEVDINPEYDYYRKGSKTTLTAQPEKGWYFQGWRGDHSCTDKIVTITMDKDKEITAQFTEEKEDPYFKTNIISPKEGDYFYEGETVQVYHSVKNTGEIKDTQKIQFRINSQFEDKKYLTIKPGETKYRTFTWTAEKGYHELKVKSEDHQDTVGINVKEEPPEYKELKINKEGNGTTQPKPGTHIYEKGEKVEVEATPEEGWYFEEWSGDHSCGDKKIIIEMNEDKEITANFKEEPTEYRELTINTEGNGTTQPKPGTHIYEKDTEVEIEATADENWYFEEWTGDKESNETKITLNMTEDKEITANFKEEEPKMEAELIKPLDGATDVSKEAELEVRITHSEEKETNISFIDSKENKELGTYKNVENGTRVQHTWKDLDGNTTYEWYVQMESGNETETSETWSFTTEHIPADQISVSAGGDRVTTVNTPIELRGTASSYKSRITKYKWDFNGDGEWDYKSNTSGITTTTYDEPGEYKARLQVIDANNNKNHDTARITIREEIRLVPDEETIVELERKTKNQVRITPTYIYDPEGNTTRVEYEFRNTKRESRHLQIKAEIPTKVAATTEDLLILPGPDGEEVKNLPYWNVSLAPEETTTIAIEKQGFLQQRHIEDIEIDIREREPRELEPEEEVEEPVTIGGLVTGAFANPAIGAAILLALIIISLAYYKREEIKERLEENLEK